MIITQCLHNVKSISFSRKLTFKFQKEFTTPFQGGKTPINRAQYEKLWRDYILSDDKKDKGNSLFGGVKED